MITRFKENSEDAVTRLPDHVHTTHSPDGGIVLDIRHGRMFSLNPVASKIVELLAESREPAFVAQRIAEVFDVSPEIALRDIEEFLATLESHALVETQDSGAAI